MPEDGHRARGAFNRAVRESRRIALGNQCVPESDVLGIGVHPQSADVARLCCCLGPKGGSGLLGALL
eukprot:8661386-Pyramimonas_sp.AAC.1